MYTGPALMYGLNLVVLFVLVIGYMLSINPLLTFYTLLPLPLLSLGIYLINSRINKKSEQIQRSLSELSTFTQEAFSGIRVLKAFVQEQRSADNFAVESNNYRAKQLNLARLQAFFFPMMMGLVGLSTILTVYVGGLEVAKGNATTGNIAEFIIYINMLTWPVASLGWITSITQRAAASQKRIDEFLLQPTEIVSGSYKPDNVKGNIH
jgi:ATP-binding cassette subfamily B protein